MYAMRAKDKRELDAYRALGTVEELRERLSKSEPPFPEEDEGFAPRPLLYWGPDPCDRTESGLLTNDEDELDHF